MPMSRYIVVAVVRCSRACCTLARAVVELAEAEVAVGDEGAHTASGRDAQCLLVPPYTPIWVPLLRVAREFSEQVQRIGKERVEWRQCERPIGEAPSLIEPLQQETRTPKQVVAQA